MMASNENVEQQPTADQGNNQFTVHQIAQTTNSKNLNATSVSVLLPQKQHYLPDNPDDNLKAIGKRPCSNFSSRSSRRRLELEVEIAADKGLWKQHRQRQNPPLPQPWVQHLQCCHCIIVYEVAQVSVA